MSTLLTALSDAFARTLPEHAVPPILSTYRVIGFGAALNYVALAAAVRATAKGEVLHAPDSATKRAVDDRTMSLFQMCARIVHNKGGDGAAGIAAAFAAIDDNQSGEVNLQLIVGERHSVAIYGQLLLFCYQSIREKAWRSRKRGA